MWNTVWLIPGYGSIYLIVQLALASGGQPCTFQSAGSVIATYCESNCCDNACCGQTQEDTRTPSIVLGVIAAVILVTIVVVILLCCCKHRCPCHTRRKNKNPPMSDNVISILDEEESEKESSRRVSWMKREATFSIYPSQ